ncbi:hypothetical protein VCCP104417_2544, partial [Vibrio cholerae CP1044(17)]
MHRYQILDQP